MSRRSTAEGMQVKAFADHLGKSVQWARKLKRENAPEWIQFNQRGSSPAAPPAPAAPATSVAPMDDVERALVAKEQAWQLYTKAHEAAAQGSTVLAEQVALNRAMKDAQDAYEKARKHAAAVQVEAQKWVSIEKVAAIRSACQQLADVVQNWETTLAGALPDEVRPAFHKAFQESKPAWNRGIKALDDYICTLLPAPC